MVEQQDISVQLDMSQGFVLQLYCICNQKCKDLIISFIKGNINNKSKTDIDYLVNYYFIYSCYLLNLCQHHSLMI